ncbi:MAG: hypothetical protein LUD78_03115, partial [Clostridiales bacterium]|nr:hypothetical protein [Clostridiales bacterium]
SKLLSLLVKSSINQRFLSSMSWYEDDLEENGISEIEEIEFQLTAYDNKDWTGDYFVDETVTLNP